jgi:hypothetical protein
MTVLQSEVVVAESVGCPFLQQASATLRIARSKVLCKHDFDCSTIAANHPTRHAVLAIFSAFEHNESFESLIG